MEKSKEELQLEEVTMVDVVALVLVTRKDNGALVEIGEEFQLPEESVSSLIERNIVCHAADYVPPVVEGELEIEIQVEIEEEVIIEEFEQTLEEDINGPLPEELEIFKYEGDNK